MNRSCISEQLRRWLKVLTGLIKEALLLVFHVPV